MPPNRETWPSWLLTVLLAVATFSAFSPVVQNEFIKFDDGFYVVRNPHVASGLSWNNLRWALAAGYQGNWHPVTWFAHMLDVQLFGMRPGWHHLINLLFHTINTVLLFVLLRRLTGAVWRSLLVAALFGLHPLHVESVAWIAERKDMLSTLFLFLTLLAYAEFAKYAHSSNSSSTETSVSPAHPSAVPEGNRLEGLFPPMRRAYLATLLFFALGLMSKPMLVTVPFLLLLLDFWPLGRFSTLPPKRLALTPLLREKAPFFALALASSVVTLIVQQENHATYLRPPLGTRLANALVSYWIYLGKTFWPAHLSIFYPHPASGLAGALPWSAAALIAAALVLVAVTCGAWLFRRSAPWFTIGWLWFLGTLLPVIGIVQVGGQALADRYTYIPLIGIFIAFAWGIAALTQWRAFLKPPLAISSGAILAICAVLTQQQVKIWRSDFTVFAHALALNPHNALACYHLGIAYRDQGQTAKALTEFQAAVKADPTFALAYPEIGGILEDQGKPQQALAVYQRGLQAAPGAGQLHDLVATRLWAQGKQEEALAQYATALHCDPKDADAHFNFGVALSSRGQFTDAAFHFAAACRLRPDDREALSCLAETLMKEGRLSQAEDRYRELTQLSPTNALAHQNLGLLLVERGNLNDALKQFEQAVAVNPNWPEALNALAWLLATHPSVESRNPAQAVKLAERACQLTGDKQPRFLGTLDVAYASAGRFADALRAAVIGRELAEAAGQTNAAQAAAARIENYKQQLSKTPP